MSSKTWQISRRTMLRGIGAAMGLPLLEAMVPPSKAMAATPAGQAASTTPPTRMAALFMPNGVNEHAWTPKGVGSEFELSEILQPLAPHKKDILVLTELMNKNSRPGDGHYVKTSGFLTGTTITKTTGKNLRSGNTSMDQIVAKKIGWQTPLPSLELGIDPVTTGIDRNVDYTRLYGSFISWSNPTTPVPCEINPKLAFNRLFRQEPNSDPEDNQSVLDLVLEDAKNLKGKVGQADRRKIDEYLDAVRSVEKRIDYELRNRKEEEDFDPKQLAAIGQLEQRIKDYYGDRDDGQGGSRRGNHTEQVRLMMDIMVLAFWTDTTRVSTFMFGNAVSGKNFSFLDGVRGGFHPLSHHENKAENLEMYKRINIWHMEQYAYMLQRMAEIPEGDGTLLDNSMVLCGSALKDGNSHNPHNLPIVLAGKGGGTVKTGRHIVHEKNTPLCNLYLSMMERMDTPVERFADSTGPLDLG